MKTPAKNISWTRVLSLFLLLFLVSCSSSNVVEGTSDAFDVSTGSGQPLETVNGMVVSAHVEASRAGAEILRKGGNAVDAAVATGFALAVVYPVAGNIGGGGFMVIRDGNGDITSYDYREKAPLKASRDMFLDSAGEFISERSQRGYLASGVPGSVAGLVKSQSEQGVLPLAVVLEPAIRLAEEGFVLTDRHAARFNSSAMEFRDFPGTAKYFTKGSPDNLYKGGERFFQRDLGKTLRRIAENGHDGFYRGETADLIIAEMNRGGGLITHEDLENYEAVERQPVVGSYRGHRIISMAPPSSGGVALLQLLNAVEPYDLGDMSYHASETVHLMGEAMRRVYADRAEWLGDPDYFDVPVNGLTEKSYMIARMEDFLPDQVSSSDSVSFGRPIAYESNETTHYSVVDGEGNAVSVTTTINGGYGSMVVVDGAGFFLNNEMDDFSAKPGEPNMFGLVGSEANSIAPEKRMLSSMTPTIVENPQGELMMVVGTPGGSTIITTVFQTIVNVIDFGMNIQEAVSSPRFHHQWLPDRMYYESRAFPADVVRNLEQRGWEMSKRSGSSGSCNSILVVRERASSETDPSGIGEYRTRRSGRVLLGAPDPRGESAAVGF